MCAFTRFPMRAHTAVFGRRSDVTRVRHGATATAYSRHLGPLLAATGARKPPHPAHTCPPSLSVREALFYGGCVRAVGPLGTLQVARRPRPLLDLVLRSDKIGAPLDELVFQVVHMSQAHTDPRANAGWGGHRTTLLTFVPYTAGRLSAPQRVWRPTHAHTKDKRQPSSLKSIAVSRSISWHIAQRGTKRVRKTTERKYPA